jgi:tetratricopeptide (TPR) repeat protein
MSDPPNPTPEAAQEFQQLLETAQERHRNDDLDGAEALYSVLLSRVPADVVVLHLLGVLKNQRGDFRAATGYLGRSLELNPRSPLAHLNMGNALLGLDQLPEALAHFQHALRFNPELPEALLNSAAVLTALGRPAEALARLDRLLALRPEHPDALANRGNALLALDRPEEALASYERAIVLDPHHREALENRDNPRLHSRIAVKAKLAGLHGSGPADSADTNCERVLFLLPPYMCGEDGECGEHPLESDLHFHFEQSFLALGYAVVKPKWNFKAGRIHIDLDDLSRLLDGETFSCCLLEINFMTREDLAAEVWYRNPELVAKLKSRVGRVITFIGDAYPRGGIIKLIETAHALSTLVWCPYQGVRGMLQMHHRTDLLERIDTTPSLPTVFAESAFTRFPENRAYEVSYIGTSKRLRLNAVAEFCRLDNLKIFVNTTTRDFNALNDAKPMKYFLDILDRSVATITTTARSPEPMDTGFEGIRATFPEVFSGRFAEAISRGCLPIYIAKDSQDVPPLQGLEAGVHYFRIERTHEYLATLQALRGLDRVAAVAALRDYHAAHLSPQALLRPVLERAGTQAGKAVAHG